MNYQNIYNALVEKAKVRGLDKSQHEGYFEIHHIIPRCLGGSDEKDNLVMFTGREHFIAHMLLWRAYPQEVSLMRAAFLMSSRWRSGGLESSTPLNSKTYARLREEYAQAVSEQCSGENNPMYGKTHTEEARQKLKTWYANNPDHHLRVMAYKRGITLDEARAIKVEKEERKALFRYNRDNGIKRPLTDTQRAALLKANTGRSVTEETKEKFSKKFKALEKQPWDTYNVKVNESIQLRWVYSDLIKKLWEINGSLGHKFFTSIYNELMNENLPIGSLKSMVDKFKSGWEPSTDIKWISFYASSLKDENYKSKLMSLEKPLSQLKEEYFADWLANRDSHRNKLDTILQDMGITKHLNNSKSSLSVVDVAEANILYNSGVVQKKEISKLFDVKPNTISQLTSPNLRFKEITDNLESILMEFYKVA